MKRSQLVIGVVDDRGAQMNEFNRLCFVFSVWCSQDNSIRTTPLTVMGDVHDRYIERSDTYRRSQYQVTMRTAKRQIEPESIVCARVILGDVDHTSLIELLHTSDVDSDTISQVERAAFEKKHPVRRVHPNLGEIVYRAEYQYWSVAVAWNSTMVEIILGGERDSGPDTNALIVAEMLLRDQPIWHLRLWEFLVTNTLPGLNSGWFVDEEGNAEILSPDEFRSRFVLRSIHVRGDNDQNQIAFSVRSATEDFSLYVEGTIKDGFHQTNIVS